MALTIHTGSPGEVWTNDTGKAAFQFSANWHNTCGLCAQFDGQIGPYWPIPLHHGCRCSNVLVRPGGQAKPFTDFRATIDGLDPLQRNRVVGASNIKLIDSGVAEWGDVVTPARVRTFAEVVDRKKLTAKMLADAGISKHIAEAALAIGTSAERVAALRAAKIIENAAKSYGVSREMLIRGASKVVAERLTAKGPSGESSARKSAPNRGEVVAVAVAALAAKRRRSDKIEQAPIVPPGIKPEFSAKVARKILADAVGERVAAAVEVVPLRADELAELIATLVGYPNPDVVKDIVRRLIIRKPE